MYSFLLSSFLILPHLIPFAAALRFEKVSFWHDGDTTRPTPKDILFVNFAREDGDPNRVDLLLYNVALGNDTLSLGNLDPLRDAKVGFEIPWVSPGNFRVRAVTSTNQQFINESSIFQIYGIGATSSSIPLPLSTATTPTSTKPSTAAANNRTGRTGIIIGATLGGIVFVLSGLMLIFLLQRKRWPRQEMAQASLSKTHLVPDHIERPSSPSSPAPNSRMSSRSAQAAATRAEVLRRERERLDKEITELKGTTRILTTA